MPYSAFGWTTAILGDGAVGAALESHEDVDGQRVSPLTPRDMALMTISKPAGSPRALASTVQVGVPTPNQFLGEVWVNERG
jgi:hypothetical protein